MNILMALSQREVTGAEVYAATLTDQLMKRGHNVVIVSDTLTVNSDAKFYPIAFNRRFLPDRIGHVRKLCQIIKEHDIQVVHAHSRASSWSCAIACKICRIPMITTTHGRQPVHFTRKLNKCFGIKSICVCENIQSQICNDLGYAKEDTVLLRNPVDADAFKFVPRDVSCLRDAEDDDSASEAQSAEQVCGAENGDALGLAGDAAQGLAEDAAQGLAEEAAVCLAGDAVQGLAGDAAQCLAGEAAVVLAGDAAQGLVEASSLGDEKDDAPGVESQRAADIVGARKDSILVALVGRLSGPKGDVAYEVLKHLNPYAHIHVQIIGSRSIPARFDEFKDCENIEFLGYRTDIPEMMQKADVIIGAGRVGIEAILTGRPLISIGEAIYEGLVSRKSIGAVLSSNFGDINQINTTRLDFSSLKDDVEAAISMSVAELTELRDIVKHEFDLNRIVNTVEQLYSRTYVEYKHYEMPVIMYHRVIDSPDEAGVHGTYVTKETFRKHLELLKRRGIRTVTFKELAEDHLLAKRFDKNNKFVVLTFDDGYEDNYRVMFPILKEYGAKAVIFLLSESTYNQWDADNKDNPEKRLSLMTADQVKEMEAYGVEFGAHTKNHPFLSQLPIEEAREQIVQSKDKLEETYGHPFISFAYPYGDLNDAVKEEVRKAGFTFGVSTDSGEISVDSDLFQIRRIAIFPRNSMLTFLRKVSGRYNFIKMRREEKAYGHHN